MITTNLLIKNPIAIEIIYTKSNGFSIKSYGNIFYKIVKIQKHLTITLPEFVIKYIYSRYFKATQMKWYLLHLVILLNQLCKFEYNF